MWPELVILAPVLRIGAAVGLNLAANPRLPYRVVEDFAIHHV